MLIYSITLNNFRQYKGEQTVNFSTDLKRNVTVILGDNTGGKTTLLQAFSWVLYGKVDFDSRENLLNSEIISTMRDGDTANMEVSLKIKHKGIIYYISRSRSYVKINNKIKKNGTENESAKVEYKAENGERKKINTNNSKNTIDSMIPEELSSYFFFDTERISNISNTSDVSKAVKKLLGLSVLNEAVSDIGDTSKKTTALGLLQNDLDLEENSEAGVAKKEIEKIEKEREFVNDKIKNIENGIDTHTKDKKKYEEIIKEAEDAKKMQEEKNQLEKSINNNELELGKKSKQMITSFNLNPELFLAQPLIEKANDTLKKAKIDDKGIRDIHANAIKDLIKRKKCICGTRIDGENEAYQHLMEEMKYMPPMSIGTMLKIFKDDHYKAKNIANNYFLRLESDFEGVLNESNILEEKYFELDALNEQLENTKSVQEAHTRYEYSKNKLQELNDDLAKMNVKIGEINGRESELQKTLDNQAKKNKNNEKIYHYMQYALEVKKWILETYEEKEQVIKDSLQESVNRLFNEMYHGKRRVVIDDKFRVNLKTTVGNNEIITDESKGLETVKNFSFVSALVELAKKRVAEIDGENMNEIISEPYPLVMDAPFSNADERHVKNIAKTIPHVAEQVIIIVMEKDWGYANQVISDKLGKEYKINKISETYSVLEEAI